MDAQDWAGRSANKTHVECLPWWDPQGHIRNEGGWCSSIMLGYKSWKSPVVSLGEWASTQIVHIFMGYYRILQADIPRNKIYSY